jgi:predicted HicB family RNase H-like nuclease
MNDDKVLMPLRVNRTTRKALKVYAAKRDVSVNSLFTAPIEQILKEAAEQKAA